MTTDDELRLPDGLTDQERADRAHDEEMVAHFSDRWRELRGRLDGLTHDFRGLGADVRRWRATAKTESGRKILHPYGEWIERVTEYLHAMTHIPPDQWFQLQDREQWLREQLGRVKPERQE